MTEASTLGSWKGHSYKDSYGNVISKGTRLVQLRAAKLTLFT